MDAVFLLEGRLVRLVDDDQAEVGVGQEQRRARADDHFRFARRDAPPRAAALRRAQARMPRHRSAAEAGLEALEERLGQRDLGKQDQRLAVLAEAFGDGFEIDLGLARAGHPVEQHRVETLADRLRPGFAAAALCSSFRSGGAWSGSGSGQRTVGIDQHRLERAGVDQPAHHRVADLGNGGEFADGALAALDCRERFLALRRQPLGRAAGRRIFGELARPVERRRRRQHHPQHRGQWREVIIGRPLAQPPQLRGDRRHVEHAGQRPQPVVADLLGRQPLGVPRDPDQLPRPKRRDDDRAGLDLHVRGHAIIERAQRRVQGDNSGPGNTHAGCHCGERRDEAIHPLSRLDRFFTSECRCPLEIVGVRRRLQDRPHQHVVQVEIVAGRDDRRAGPTGHVPCAAITDLDPLEAIHAQQCHRPLLQLDHEVVDGVAVDVARRRADDRLPVFEAQQS